MGGVQDGDPRHPPPFQKTRIQDQKWLVWGKTTGTPRGGVSQSHQKTICGSHVTLRGIGAKQPFLSQFVNEGFLQETDLTK